MRSVINTTLALALALFASASPLRRDAGLSVSIEAPASVDSLDDLKVVTKITNTGSSALKVLTYNTPLTQALVQNFQLTKDDEDVAFTGVRGAFSLSQADDSVWKTLQPQESTTVDHQIGSIFDFAKAGSGDFQVASANKFFYVDAAAATSTSFDDLQSLDATSNSVTVNVNGDLKAKTLTHDKRARTSGCSSSQNTFIYAALSEGKALATQSANYISSNGANSVFTTYFGSGATTSVRSVFTSVAAQDVANDNSGTLWYCSDPYSACSSGVIAYSVPSAGVGAFCSIFFQERPTSALCSGDTVANRDIRGATWLHEETHLLAGTQDYGYGVSFDQNLARTNPSQARNNADNYNTFAEQVYANSC